MKSLILAAGLATFAGTAWADINIGVVAPLSGAAAAQGGPSKTGMELAIPTEIKGQKVNVIVLDDSSDPAVANRNTQKLISEYHVDVILGNIATPSSLAMANLTTAAKVPQISIAPISFGDERDAFIFNIPAPPRVWIVPIAEDMVKRGVKKVGFIGFSDPWGDMTLAALKEQAELHGFEIVAEERFARADTSVSGPILKLLSQSPDAVFIGGAGTPAALPNLALKERGFAGPIYNTNGIFNKDFNKLVGSGVNGINGVNGAVAVAGDLPDSEPRKAVALDFIKKYDDKVGANSWDAGAAFGYDAGLIVAAALEKAADHAEPGTEAFRAAVADGIRQLKDFPGAHSIYNFTDPKHPWGVDGSSVLLLQFEDGQWHLAAKEQ